MNIDLHSHFFPVEALQNPGKFENHAPKLALHGGKLSVKSRIDFRPDLGLGAYAPMAKVLQLELSDAERRQILGGNAAKALQL